MLCSPRKAARTTAREEGMAGNRTWNDEDTYWRSNFSSRPYATGRTYEDFEPGYRYGFESGSHHLGRTWDDVEPDSGAGGTSINSGGIRPGRTSRTPFATRGTG